MRTLAFAFGMVTMFNVTMGWLVVAELMRVRRRPRELELHQARQGVEIHGGWRTTFIDGLGREMSPEAVERSLSHTRHLRRIK